ncbi:MAG: dUTP diphosphatase [Alphaproteobacteria bacterium]
MPKLKFQILPHGVDLPLPSYATEGSAGMDLYAAICTPVKLEPFERRLIPTGLQIELPPNHEGQVRPRSGLALKQGLTVLNAPGTVDCDYRGEVGVILINLSDTPQEIQRGDRIAQLIITPYVRAEVVLVSELTETSRGSGGFGSTGR